MRKPIQFNIRFHRMLSRLKITGGYSTLEETVQALYLDAMKYRRAVKENRIVEEKQ